MSCGVVVFIVLDRVSRGGGNSNSRKLSKNNNYDLIVKLLSKFLTEVHKKTKSTFFNNVGIASSVSEIYFDDGTLLRSH